MDMALQAGHFHNFKKRDRERKTKGEDSSERRIKETIMAGDGLDKLKVAELKEKLAEKGLATTGLKADLLARLREAIAAGTAGSAAPDAAQEAAVPEPVAEPEPERKPEPEQ